MVTFEIPADAQFYRGSGYALAAIRNGAVVDASYHDLPDYFAVKRSLQEKHPGARVVGGMMSSYQFTLFDPRDMTV